MFNWIRKEQHEQDIRNILKKEKDYQKAIQLRNNLGHDRWEPDECCCKIDQLPQIESR